MCLYPRLIDSSLSRVDERAKQRFDGLSLPAIDISIRLTLTRREKWLRNRERAKEKTSLLTIYLLATARKKKEIKNRQSRWKSKEVEQKKNLFEKDLGSRSICRAIASRCEKTRRRREGSETRKSSIVVEFCLCLWREKDGYIRRRRKRKMGSS